MNHFTPKSVMGGALQTIERDVATDVLDWLMHSIHHHVSREYLEAGGRMLALQYDYPVPPGILGQTTIDNAVKRLCEDGWNRSHFERGYIVVAWEPEPSADQAVKQSKKFETAAA